jgi:hypothetical protein
VRYNGGLLTQAQKLKVARLTPADWSLLRRAETGDEIDGAAMTQIARKLHRRGFIKCAHGGDGWWRITLTEVGKAVLAMKRD